MTVASQPSSVKVLIIGAGPTGLGAAIRMTELGERDWILIDSSEEVGGLSSTSITPEGFLFDLGGHVLFSHYAFFDDAMELAIPNEGWNTHERVSYVWIRDRWVPYPFQSNLHRLPLEDKIACVSGAIDAALQAKCSAPPKSFDEWILKSLGNGIADLFMRPYNLKVWAYPTTFMSSVWLGERVASVNAVEMVENVLREKDAKGWGPNAVFKFPKKGGTGAIWKRLGECVKRDKIILNKKVIKIDPTFRQVSLNDGSIISYDSMISTCPLDITLQSLGRSDLAEGLVYSSTHIIGIGVRGTHSLSKKCWLYFPEDNCPFYRCTVFSNYSEYNCPDESVELRTLRLPQCSAEDQSLKKGPYYSLMFEISESPFKPAPTDPVEATLQGALATGLLSEESEIVSVFYKRLERGYPVPSLGRDAALERAFPFLESHGIFSRGRFGAWKYEVANQDHSFMQGVEAVDAILADSFKENISVHVKSSYEPTLNTPNVVNKAKKMHPRLDKRRFLN